MSKHLTFSQQVQVINHYKIMTPWDMSVAFDIDETKLRIFMQQVGLEVKAEVKKEIRPAFVKYQKSGPEKEIIVRPPAMYSNRQHGDILDYYEGLNV